MEPKRCASQRNRKFADGGLPADKKIEQLVFQSQARRKAGRGAGGRASRLGTPGPSRSASAARRARVRSKKREKGGRPKGTDSRGGAPDARPKTHALQNDTPRPEPAPAGMLQGLPIAAERRAVGWGNGERRWRGRCDVDRWPSCGAGRARAARSGSCRPPPGYLFAFSRLKIAVPAANLVRWWALSSSGWGLGAEEGRDAVCWVPCGVVARERQGAARADLLPADSSPFPVKDCSSGRESGSLRLKGGNG